MAGEARYLDPAVVARLGTIDLMARTIVEGFLTGLHRSPYKGFSVEFAEHRQYIPGDDLARLDWKVYDHELLDQSACTIVERAKATGAKVHGPIPLPTRVERYTVLRSPHCDKKSREQFEIRTHKRLIDILDTTAKTVGALGKLNLPVGVDIKIKAH